MRTGAMLRQRALLLRLKLKHKFTIVEFIDLDIILAEIAVCERAAEGWWY